MLENILTVSLKVKHKMTLQTSDRTPTYLPREMKTYVHKKTCTQMFKAALFILIKK